MEDSTEAAALAGEHMGGESAAPDSAARSPASARTAASTIADYRALFKDRVTALVVVSAWAGYYMGSVRTGSSSLSPALTVALAGVALATAGSAALNECIEHSYDAKMKRTSNRPIAAGRIGLIRGVLLGLGAVLAGCLWLSLAVNTLTGLLTFGTALVYVAVYTPLKHRTSWATFVGAIPGAMGPVLGWAAVRGRLEWPAAALFAILFVWQFPHVMAISWLYREDYRRAGIRMSPVVHPDGRSAASEALACAALMIPVSLAPVFLHMAGVGYAAAAVVLGLVYLGYAVRFQRIAEVHSAFSSDRYAQELFRVSVIYLPLLLAALALDAGRG